MEMADRPDLSPATAQKWRQRAVKAEQLLETITSRVGEVRAAFSAKVSVLFFRNRCHLIIISLRPCTVLQWLVPWYMYRMNRP